MFAAADVEDKDHRRCAAVFDDFNLQFVFPALIVAKAAYFIATRLGAAAEAALLRTLSDQDVELPAPEDWEKIARLVEKYADFPLGAADASIVVLAERLGTDLIVTLDRRHFGALRTVSGGTFRILPD
ncbi:MAG TPA: PIN domain-containing protein [Dehalococcoidia bacterium]|nr:PIN domain-containing protein [Dehalococcoidia bacterium]